MGLSLELKIIFLSHSKVVDITSVELLSQSGSACSHSDSEDSEDCQDILQGCSGLLCGVSCQHCQYNREGELDITLHTGDWTKL